MPDYKRTKRACYFSYLSMSSVFSLPPLLFITFHEMYGISYTVLGTLLLLNYCTQLVIDLIFTFFSKRFNIKLTVRIMPLITAVGMSVFAAVPLFFPQKAIIGLVVGTIIFSVAAGLSEVLVSPLIAAVPSEHPDKDMSLLHSLYGWGVVTVVVISSAFFKIFGTHNWMYLAFFWAALPIIASVLYFISPIPDMNLSQEDEKKSKTKRSKGIFLCAVCIFLGSSSENIMTGWISSYMEKSLLIPKAVGDILGMAMFALLLAFTRSLYAKFGKNILNTLLISMAGAVVCYLTAGLSSSVIAGFIACVFTGIFTSMLWPGTLIMMEENVPSPGVAAFALMAACGDLGASVAPQLTGMIVDKISAAVTPETAQQYSANPDQIGFKIGMLFAAIFPILGLIWVIFVRKNFLKKSDK